MRGRYLFVVIGLGLSFCGAYIHAAGPDNWPQFRGLTGGVVPDDVNLPESWSRTENIAWKADVPGLGWGSPIVWGDDVFVTAAIRPDRDEAKGVTPGTFADKTEKRQPATGTGKDPDFTTPRRWVLYAFDFKTGTRRWQTELRSGLPLEKKYLDNTYASETPVTDGRRVYVYHASAGMFAVDFNGRIVWSRDLHLPTTDPNLQTTTHEAVKTANDSATLPPTGLFDIGSAASPVLHNGRLYLRLVVPLSPFSRFARASFRPPYTRFRQ